MGSSIVNHGTPISPQSPRGSDADGPATKWDGFLVDVNSDKFNMAVGVVIVVNACAIGLETDNPPNLWFDILEQFFAGKSYWNGWGPP